MRRWLPCAEEDAKKDAETHGAWLAARLAFAVRTRDAEVFRVCTSQLSSALNLKAVSPSDRRPIAEALIAALHAGFGADSELRCLDALVRLLRRHRHSSDSDGDGGLMLLRVAWEPLYDRLLATHFPKQRVAAALNRHAHGEALVEFVRVARRFFAPGSAAQILARVRPMLCPHSGAVFVAQALLAAFLPTAADDCCCDSAWIGEVFAAWPWFEGVLEWNLFWLDLLSRFARDQAGVRAWGRLQPHVHAIFTHVLRVLALPVGGSAQQQQQAHGEAIADVRVFLRSHKHREPAAMTAAARLLVYLLEPSGAAQRLLENLFRYIEPFYHPSNGGKWSDRLARFLKSLCSQFAKRIGRERRGEIPAAFCLSQRDIRAFAATLVPIICKSQYSKSQQVAHAAAKAAMRLAYVDPAAVLPPLLDTVFPALETLTETHQTCSALQMLGYISRPLLWRAHFPEGPAQLSRLLYLALPGIDVNDMVKTGVTLRFVIEVLQWMPLIDATETCPEPEAPADKAAWQLTGMFGDWVCLLLDRIFGLFGMQPAAERGESLEEAIGALVRGLSELLFQSMSDSIYATALHKLATFISTSILPNAVRAVGHTVSAACAPRPAESLKVFVPMCHAALVSEPGGGLNQLSDNETLWFLRVAEQAMKRTGKAVLPYRTKVLDMINGALGSSSKGVVKAGCKLVKSLLRGLTATYPQEFRAFNDADFSDPEIFKRWGEAALVEKLDAKWHIPSASELEFAAEIVDTYGLSAMRQLEALLASDIVANTPSTSPTLPAESSEVSIAGAAIPVPRRSSAAAHPEVPALARSPPATILFRTGALPQDTTDATPAATPSQPVAIPTTPASIMGPSLSPTPVYSRGRPFGASLSPAPQDFFRLRSVSLAPAAPFSSSALGRRVTRMSSLSGAPSGSTTPTGHGVTPPPPAAIAHLWASKRLREQMLRLIFRLRCVITGTAAVLIDSEEALPANVPVEGWRVKWTSRWRHKLGEPQVLQCKVSRDAIGEFLHSFATSAIASHQEDDPSLLKSLAKAIGTFVTKPRGVARSKLVAEVSYHTLMRSDSRDGVDPKRCFPRWMHISKLAHMYAEILLNNSYADPYSKLQDDLARDLYALSLNSFSEVRKKAQPAFAAAMHRFPQAQGLFVPALMRLLGDSEAKDWQITGAAYLIHQPSILRNVAVRWDTFCAFINGICQSYSHDKPTVQTRLYNLYSSVTLLFDEIRLRKRGVLSSDPETLSCFGASRAAQKEDLDAADTTARKETETNFALLESTVNTLLSVAESMPPPPPRYMLIIASSLFLLTTGVDCVPSARLVDFFLRGLHSDLPNYRSVCIRGLTFALLRLKPAHAPRGTPNIFGPPPLMVAGYPDVLTEPPITTAAEWERTCFVDKSWVGWNGAPTPKVVLPETLLAKADPLLASRIEKTFWSPDFVQTLLTGMVNSKRQNSAFSESSAQFWKGLSQLFRMRLVLLLQPKLEELVSNITEQNSQQVASEVFAGTVRGSKHWPFGEQQQLWAFARPLLRKALGDAPLESVEDWCACLRFISFDRDPRRLRWLVEELEESASSVSLGEVNTSQAHAKRLKFLQQVISELTWRAISLNDRTLGLVETVISHPYKQVRDRVALMLKVLFRNSWVPARDPETRFLAPVLPPVLHTREAAFVEKVAADDSFEKCSKMPPTGLADPAFQPCMSFVRTVVTFITLSSRSGGVLAGKTVEFFLQSLPHLFRLKDHPSQDICGEVRACLGSIANISMPQPALPALAETFSGVFDSAKWHTRMAALPVLEVLAYKHVFLLEGGGLSQLLGTVTALLSDPQLEVRVQTSKTLAGLLKLLDESTVDTLRERFLEQAESAPPASKQPESLPRRHGGVLGVASVILAHPYDVPLWMPDLLLRFAAFINDPLPVKTSVRQTFMEFWRTHSDSWEATFKERFTGDQLAELTQLLVSPSYFA